MNKFLRCVAIAALTAPLAWQAHAAPTNQNLPPQVVKALKANKIETNALSVVMLPLNAKGAPTFVNADV